jgi:predicted dehydrogenase
MRVKMSNSPNPELRYGLIGCGDIGQLRAQALAQSQGARLVAVADVDQTKAGDTAQRYGARADRDWQSLIARDDVDAVIVSTPPRFHVDMCVDALNAGKHVLCEKPLARTPGECRRILAAEEKSGRRVATGFNYRFYPSFAKARQLLDSGIIGTLDHVRSYGGYSATSHNQPWVHDAETVGGGALRDIGIHILDLTRDFRGEVDEVVGMASSGVWKYAGCEDNGFALLRSSSGNIASVHASWTEWRRYRFMIEIYGDRGCIRASCFPMMTQVVWADEPGGRTRRRTDWFPAVAIGEKLRSYRWVVVQSFIREYEAFGALVRGESSRIATGFDGLRAIEIANAASAGLPHAFDDSAQGGPAGALGA